MQFVTCRWHLIRLTPNHRVEMVSQLLFGECCTINETDKNGWVQITCKAMAIMAGHS
ncbi:MAG: hypothetical protein WDM90_19380 [Ferruginibacter sp.]